MLKWGTLKINTVTSLLFNSKLLRIAVLLTVTLASANVFIYTGKLFYIQPVLYLYLLFYLYSKIESNKGIFKKLFLLLPFGVWTVITSIWSPYPDISLIRSFYFILMSMAALAVAVFCESNSVNVLNILLPLNIIVVVSSLICIVSGFPAESWTGGNGKGFMGFTTHQNTLGALILFTIPAVTYQLYEKFMLWKAKGIKFNSPVLISLIFYFFLFTFSFLLALWTHSRASIIGILIFFSVLVIFNFNKKYILILAGIISVFISSLMIIPQSNKYFVSYLMKAESRLGDNRVYLFEASYHAALQGGLFGLGYGVSSPSIKIPAAGSHFENGRYIREKGNSILALIEEVGFIGLILFLAPVFLILAQFIKKFRKGGKFNEWPIDKNSPSPNNSILTASGGQSFNHPITRLLFPFSFFLAACFHAQFEAWWVGVTSYQLFIFMAILSTLTLNLNHNFKLFQDEN